MAITDRRMYAWLSRHFRRSRNAALSAHIAEIANPRILDVGGLPVFWDSVPGSRQAVEIVIVNSEAGEHSSLDEIASQKLAPNMSVRIGDACALEYEDYEFDVVVCNSVLEHIGSWDNARSAAVELARVGKHGWVQVPAYEFPLEVHYMRPFVHWFAEPTRAKLLRLPVRRFRHMDESQFRNMFAYVPLLNGREFRWLLPGNHSGVASVTGVTGSGVSA